MSAASFDAIDAQVPLDGAFEHRVELILVEGDAEMVDTRNAPVARLHDHVHGTMLELGEPQLEAVTVEHLPGRSRLGRDVLVSDPAVPGDQIEAQLAQVASFEVAELGGDQVVMEDVHVSTLSRS